MFKWVEVTAWFQFYCTFWEKGTFWEKMHFLGKKALFRKKCAKTLFGKKRTKNTDGCIISLM